MMMIGVVRPEERVVGLSKGAFLFMVDGITTPRDNKSGTHVYSNLGFQDSRFKIQDSRFKIQDSRVGPMSTVI